MEKSIHILAALLIAPLIRAECDLLQSQGNVIAKIKESGEAQAQQPSIPVVVSSYFLVYEILDVNELQRSITLQIAFVQSWEDPRLGISTDGCPAGQTIPIPEQFAAQIWTPPTQISNSLTAAVLRAPAKIGAVTITPAGKLTYRSKIMVSIPCQVSYATFPFDMIQCNLVVGTFVPASYVVVNWTNGAPLRLITDHIRLPSFALQPPMDVEMSNAAVGWRHVVLITLQRFHTYYILTVYIPNTLVVVLAYSSFWFAPDGARAGLCLSALISISLMMNGVSAGLPKVGYVKGIDLWFLGNISLVCFAFIEYACIAFLERIAGGLDKPIGKKWTMTVKQFADILDRLFRFGFAAAFLGFCVFYFLRYVKPITELATKYDNI